MTEFQLAIKNILAGCIQLPAWTIASRAYKTCEPTGHQVAAVRQALEAIGAGKVSRGEWSSLYFVRQTPKPLAVIPCMPTGRGSAQIFRQPNKGHIVRRAA